MFSDHKQLIPRTLFEGLTREDASSEAMDELRSALIIAYEHALESGVCPSAALAAILDWMLPEFKRSCGLPFMDG
jgi:hypothetical protein